MRIEEEGRRVAEFEAARRRQEDEERAIYVAQLEEAARIRRAEAMERERERRVMEVEMRQMRGLKRLEEELRIKRELLEVAERLARLQAADVDGGEVPPRVQKAVSFDVGGKDAEKENGGTSPAGGSADSELTVVEAASLIQGRGFIVG